MKILYTADHAQHQPTTELYDGLAEPYPEVAERVDTILAALNANNLGPICKPRTYKVAHIQEVHSQQYVDFVQTHSSKVQHSQQVQPSYFISDTYAPLTRGTYQASLRAVDAALNGADEILAGEQAVYSLCRPPGHHAGHQTMGGYCYFNNAAIAGNYLSKHGKVAILDIDYHHGNGTQAVFYDRADVLYVSLHADPLSNYPYSSGFAYETGNGNGQGYNLNVPLKKDTDVRTYLIALTTAIKKIQQFAPEFLIVSAGFDTYAGDPIGGLQLNEPDYRVIGARIAALNLPTHIVQEGGYNVEHLGNMVINFLSAFADNSGSGRM